MLGRSVGMLGLNEPLWVVRGPIIIPVDELVDKVFVLFRVAPLISNP